MLRVVLRIGARGLRALPPSTWAHWTSPGTGERNRIGERVDPMGGSVNVGGAAPPGLRARRLEFKGAADTVCVRFNAGEVEM